MKFQTIVPDSVIVGLYDSEPSAAGAAWTRAPASKISCLFGRYCGSTYAPSTVRSPGNANVSGQLGSGVSDIDAASYVRGHNSGRTLRLYGASIFDTLSAGFHSWNVSAPYRMRSGFA